MFFDNIYIYIYKTKNYNFTVVHTLSSTTNLYNHFEEFFEINYLFNNEEFFEIN